LSSFIVLSVNSAEKFVLVNSAMPIGLCAHGEGGVRSQPSPISHAADDLQQLLRQGGRGSGHGAILAKNEGKVK
jgi:hypothetical protein